MDFTFLLRAYAKFRISQLNSQGRSRESLAKTQERELFKLLSRASVTQFGRDHKFSKIRSVRDFQHQVPLRRYEEMWDAYWKAAFPKLRNISWPGEVPFFALSSGTTSGATKYIPYTREIMQTTTKAGVDLLVHHVLNRPKSKLLGGKSFILTGSTELVEYAPNIIGGDMSGIAMRTMPSWARSRSYPPKGVGGIKSWEAMIETFAEKSLSADIRSLNGAPSWMLLFLEKLRQLRPESQGRLGNLYPNLEMVVHGGMSFAPYFNVYKDLLDGSHAETREVYPASEGFFAVQDRAYDEGMRLLVDHGIFYEFIPLDEISSPTPTRLWIKDVQPEIDYALVISTQAGLWGYVIGDIVRFVEITPPRIRMTGRTSYMLSAVGEHLIGEEIDRCLVEAAHDVGIEVSEYSVGAVFPTTSAELVGHKYVVEFATKEVSAEQAQRFLNGLDKRLQDINEDYAAHRKNEFGLYPPQLLIAKKDGFKEWMRSRGKLGGQNKVPRVINNQELFSGLMNFVEGYNTTQR